MSTGHGGRRPGAGRKRAPLIEPKPAQGLVQRLSAMPVDEAGLRSRAAFALAACGARDQEIAAALGLSVAMLDERYAPNIAAGREMASVNVRVEILRSATGNGRPFSVGAAKAALHFLTTGGKA